MNPESERVEVLFKLFIDGSLTEVQRVELEGYLQKYPELQALYGECRDNDAFLMREWAEFTAFDHSVAMEELKGGERAYFSPRRLMVGLTLFVVAFAAVWFYGDVSTKTDFQTRNERYKNDVAAGSNKAVATFANGESLFLADTAANYRIAGGAASGVLFSEGQITYSPTGSGRSGFNTVVTPQGGQYRVILPDGSSAKLNAASSIRFPVSFDRQQRVVEVKGEVYFDVTPDKSRPFIVNLPNGARIEVLGTSFNVKAYPDDPVLKTTLDEGSVKFKTGEDEVLIKSGEQIQLTTQASNPVLLKQTVGLNTGTSWKDGYFNFENAELTAIMKEVARWYDVEVEYETHITEQFSILMLPRNFSISRLLELLELTGHVKFTIDGRRVTVMT